MNTITVSDDALLRPGDVLDIGGDPVIITRVDGFIITVRRLTLRDRVLRWLRRALRRLLRWVRP